MLRYFSEKEVSHILGIKPGRLKYWKQIGLVAPSLREGIPCYDFQDLIHLKTTRGLIACGLPATSLKQSLDSLKRRIPDVGRNLNSQRVYAFGNRILVRHRNQLMDTQSGQMVFEFDVADLAESASERAFATTHPREVSRLRSEPMNQRSRSIPIMLMPTST